MSQARRSSLQQPSPPQQQSQPPSPPQQPQQQERGQQWRPVWRGGGAYRGGGRGKRVQGDSNGHASQQTNDSDHNNGSHHEHFDQLPQSLDDRMIDDERLQHEIREVADRIAQMQRVENDLRAQLATRSEIARLQKALADSQEHVEQIEAGHRQALWEKDEHLQQLAQQIQQKEAELWAKETQLQERDEQISEARRQVGDELNAERARASALEADVAERDRRLEQLERQLDGLLAREEEAERQLQDANNQLEEQLEHVRNKDAQLVDTSQHVEDMRQQWAQQIEEMGQYHLQQAHGLQQQLRETREQLHGMWLGSQAAAAQHVERENYHRAYVHQLQVQLKEAHDRLAAAGIQPVNSNRAFPAEFVPQQNANMRVSEPLPNTTAANVLLATQPHPQSVMAPGLPISSPPSNILRPANGTPPQPALPNAQVSTQAEHSSEAQAPSSHMSQGVAAASLANGLSAAAGPFRFGSLPTPDPTLLQTLMPVPNKNGVIGPKMESATSAVAVTPIAVVRPASQGRNSNIAKAQNQNALQHGELQPQQQPPQEQQHPPEPMLGDKLGVRKDSQRRHDNRKPKDGSTKRDDRWRSKGKEKMQELPERTQ